jgi:hypothetical protein
MSKLKLAPAAFCMLAAIVCPDVSAAGNPGRSAMECVDARRDAGDIVFHNHCGHPIFVVWCGEQKYTKKRCGDGPAGNSFYTHSTNIGPGDKQYARGIGTFRYAACEGSIAFGKDGIRDEPDGSFTCTLR